MLTNQDEIRERIIQIRKERGLSQNQLAKDFGISRTHYCNVENGKKPVTESFLKVLASGYKIPMEAFIPNENGDLMQYCECTNDFVNAMRSLNKDNEEKRIIQLGDWTGGGSGLPFSSELPNGWSVRFSASPHFDKNKQPLEEGIEPDIAINMSESDQLKHKDTLIEKAFEILSE